MIKRIIIEGADQQGKSTLAKILSEKLCWDIKHFGKPTEDFNYFTGYIGPENTISDRNFLSEVVYSKINSRDCRIPNLELLQDALIGYGAIVILMDRSHEFVFDATRHEEYSEFQIAKATILYRQEFAKLKMKKYVINPNCNNYESTVDMLIDLIKATC